MKKTVQILGKISGATPAELELFNEAEAKLIKMGFEVFNPLNVKKETHYLCLLECLKHLIDKRPIVVVLPTHTESAGAGIEIKLANKLNLTIYKNIVPAMKSKNIEPTENEIKTFEEVYKICEKHISGISKTEFYSEARYSDLTFFRGALSYALFTVFQIPCSEIGYLLKKHRTSIFHYVNLSIPSILSVNYPATQSRQIKQIILETERLRDRLNDIGESN